MITKYIVKSITSNQVLLYSKSQELFKAYLYTNNYQSWTGVIREEQGRQSKYDYVKITIGVNKGIDKKFKVGDEVYLIPTFVSTNYHNDIFSSSFQLNSKNYKILIQSHLFGENLLRDINTQQATTDFEFITVIHNTIHKDYNNSQGYPDLTSGLNGQSDISLLFTTPPFNHMYDYGRNITIPVFNDGGGYRIKPDAVIITDYWEKPVVEVTPNLRFSPSYIVIKGRSGIKLNSNDNLKLTINNTKLSTTLQELKFKQDEDVVIKLHKHVLWRGRYSNKSLIKSSGNGLSNSSIYIDSSSISNNTNLGNLITNNYVFNPTNLQRNSLNRLQFNLN